MKLEIVPIFQKEAFAFVKKFHRHHIAPVGSVFQVGLSDGDNLVGVAIVGRPVSRHLDNGFTLEVTRLCTDGSINACSMLYSACWRIGRELGYKKMITYILASETGSSLKGAGWYLVGQRGGGSWSVPSRPRKDKHPLTKKLLWSIGGYSDEPATLELANEN